MQSTLLFSLLLPLRNVTEPVLLELSQLPCSAKAQWQHHGNDQLIVPVHTCYPDSVTPGAGLLVAPTAPSASAHYCAALAQANAEPSTPPQLTGIGNTGSGHQRAAVVSG
jgi:hypothetical protein